MSYLSDGSRFTATCLRARSCFCRTTVGPVSYVVPHIKVQWFPLWHRSLQMPGAPLFSLYNPNHYYVIIRRRLSPLPPRFTHSQVPVRACGKSHGILLPCEALETDETGQQLGCWVSSLGMAASSARIPGGGLAPSAAGPGGVEWKEDETVVYPEWDHFTRWWGGRCGWRSGHEVVSML